MPFELCNLHLGMSILDTHGPSFCWWYPCTRPFCSLRVDLVSYKVLFKTGMPRANRKTLQNLGELEGRWCGGAWPVYNRGGKVICARQKWIRLPPVGRWRLQNRWQVAKQAHQLFVHFVEIPFSVHSPTQQNNLRIQRNECTHYTFSYKSPVRTPAVCKQVMNFWRQLKAMSK